MSFSRHNTFTIIRLTEVVAAPLTSWTRDTSDEQSTFPSESTDSNQQVLSQHHPDTYSQDKTKATEDER